MKTAILLPLLLVLFTACQRNEGDARIPLGTVPFPPTSTTQHLYVHQINSDYHVYEAYSSSQVSESEAQTFLKKLGFGPVEFALIGGVPSEGFPEEIKAWWNAPADQPREKLWSKALGSGYAVALVSDGKLFIYLSGDVHQLKK